MPLYPENRNPSGRWAFTRAWQRQYVEALEQDGRADRSEHGERRAPHAVTPRDDGGGAELGAMAASGGRIGICLWVL